jgi:hypothetical protein
MSALDTLDTLPATVWLFDTGERWSNANAEPQSVRPVLVTKVTPSRVSYRDPPEAKAVQWCSRMGFPYADTEAEAWAAIRTHHANRASALEQRAAEHRAAELAAWRALDAKAKAEGMMARPTP